MFVMKDSFSSPSQGILDSGLPLSGTQSVFLYCFGGSMSYVVGRSGEEGVGGFNWLGEGLSRSGDEPPSNQNMERQIEQLSF